MNRRLKSLLALAPLGALFSLALTSYASNSSWAPYFVYNTGASDIWEAIDGSDQDSTSLGSFDASSGTLVLKGAEIWGWSSVSIFWDNTYFIYKITGQDLNPGGYSSFQMPHVEQNGSDHKYKSDSQSVDMVAGIAYNGVYRAEFYYELEDSGGKFYNSSAVGVDWKLKFTVTGTNYFCDTSAAVNQDAFNGGKALLDGAGHKFVKRGTGTLSLTNANTYGGGTYIDEGKVQLTSSGTAGTGGIDIGSTDFLSSDTELLLGVTGGGKGVTNAITIKNASGATTRTIASTAAGGTTNTMGGTVSNSNSGRNLRVYQASGGTLAFTNVISGASGMWLADEGGGRVLLSGNNTFTGNTYIDNGTLVMAHAHALGSGSLNLGKDGSGSNPAYAQVDTGDLTITNVVNLRTGTTAGLYVGNTGSGAVTFAGPWNAYRDFDLFNRGTGSFTISGALNLQSGTRSLWVTGSQDVVVSGPISNGGLTKNGTGTLTLTGTNTFSGNTTVSAGTLVYNGTNTSSAVTVSGGALLRGEGSVGGVTVSDNAIVAAGTAASDVGMLTMTSLTLGAGGSNVVEMTDAEAGAGSGWDLLAASGALNANASSGNPFVIALDDVGLGNFTNTNTYAWVIMEGTSISGFAADEFSVNTTAFGFDDGGGTFSVGTNETDDIVLNFTPASGPLLSVAPVLLNFSARRGQDPAPVTDTFVVSNASLGTLEFTNTVAYGAGASGWLAIAPETGSADAGVGVTVTGTVSSASLARGTYYATNAVDGGAAGTSNVVVMLSVTGYTGVVLSEPFDEADGYAIGNVLHGKAGGEGWGANAWVRNAESPEVYIDDVALDDGFSGYCTNGSRKARINMSEATAADRFRTCERDFTAVTSGVLYVAYKMQLDNNADGGLGGIKLMDGASDKLWLGKVAADSALMAVRNDVSGPAYAYSGYTIGSDVTYLLVGKYDFSARTFSAKAYITAQFTSTDEPGPGNWDVVATMSAAITSISRVALVAERALNEADRPNIVYWDDLRLATRWADLLCGVTTVQGVVMATNATFSALDPGDKVSDHMLNSGAFPVSIDLVDAEVPIFIGTEASGFFKPDFDLLNDSGGHIVQDLDFASLTASAGGKAVTASNAALSAITASNIPLGNVTLRWSAMDSNKAYRVNVPRLEDGTDLDFTVYDEDTNEPVATIIYVGADYTSGAPIQTNITDADLNNTNEYLDIVVRWDDPSGVFMTNLTTNLQVNIGSESGRVIPNFDLYTTNTLFHTTKQYNIDRPFTNFLGVNGDVAVTTVYYNAFAITNSHSGDLYYLTLSGEDEDNDRGTEPDLIDDGGGLGDDMPFDRMVTTNQFVQFTVTDDDAEGPTYQNWFARGDGLASGAVAASQLLGGGTWSVTGSVCDVKSGLNVNTGVFTAPSNTPYVQLVDPSGTVRLTEECGTYNFPDGGGKIWVLLKHENPSAISGTDISSGTWTVRVVVADFDRDRGDSDGTASTNVLTLDVATFEWDAGGGAARGWSAADNWTANSEPTASFTAHVNGGHTAVVSSAGEAVAALFVGDNGYDQGPAPGTGTVEQTAGALTASGSLVLGENSGDRGSYAISGGTLSVGDDSYIGSNGVGTLTVSSGAAVTLSDAQLFVGYGASGVGSIMQTGGDVQIAAATAHVYVGSQTDGADGSYTITNGTLTVGGHTLVGRATGSGAGLLHIVGSSATVALGNSLSDDFTVGTNGEIRFSFNGSAITPLNVTGQAHLGGTLSISNDGSVAVGEYLLITNTVVGTGTFATTNWLGAADGTIVYGSKSVSVIFTPRLGVLGTNGVVVADGDTVPDPADGTQLAVDLPNTTTNTFTVTNEHATYELTLTNAEYVTLSGPQAGAFSITQPADSNVVANGSRTFKIAFTPSSIGVHTAAVSIVSDDLRPGKNPYTFTIHGIGQYTTEPATAASNMQFSNVSNDQMTVTWDDGSGAGALLVAKKSSSVADVPDDGTPYTADVSFSNGQTITTGEYVVYNDVGTSVTVTNLRPGVIYHFTVFEYNGSAAGINYLTSSTLSGSQKAATYAPVITNGASVARTISENEDPTPFALDVHATDIDSKYGDSGTWALGAAPAHGTASISATGFDADKPVTYTPHPYYSGTDSFQVKVTDSFGNEDRITVTVTVEPRNDAGKPVFIFE